MLHNLKLRFISILVFLGLSLTVLMLVQYNFSTKTHHLFESQLALKELHIQYMKMEESKIKYFLTHKEMYIDNLEAYVDTLDLYLNMVDEYLEEFTYDKNLENDLDAYSETFLALTEQKNHNNEVLTLKLEKNSKKIQYFITAEEQRLIPLITKKIDDIELIQSGIYIFMLLLSIFMLYNIFKPIIVSISIFKDFFGHYTSTNHRLNLERLYFDEIKEIATFVNEMLENQEKSQQVKDEFLSNMSHELRTPLNAIGGFAGVLLRKIPQEKETITPIVESSNHLLQLVSDILDLSKIQSGKFEIVEEPFALYEEIEHFMNRLYPLVNKKNIALSLDYQASKQLRLMGDWFRIAQILNNFVSNAIKFTPVGGKISLTIKYTHGEFYAGVTDSGIGIKEEALDTILKPFEQSDKRVTKEFGGTGLGLSIAKTLTDMMSGSFKIESQVGVGSTFSVEIPFKQLEDAQETISQEDETEEENEISIDAHILIAEDNKTNQMLLGMLLDDLSITFDTANDGQEALEMFEENKYDIILMDENMPNLSGTDAMLAIRKKFKNVPPIIAVTANAMKGDREKLIALGMNDFLSKPIDNDLLIQVIEKNLA